ncbi:MAG: ABC transporter substrate-binding protein [Chloroflexi bacterium]|nr:ABC transporter substrate-binding protein [Chloroflexota bacterium]
MSLEDRRRTLRGRSVSRRALLTAAGSAGVGAAGLALVGCGDDDEEAADAVAETAEPATPAEPAPEPVVEEPAGPTMGGVLREGYSRGSERMDPIAALWWDASSFPAVHETLFALDENAENLPLLAAGWEISDDGLSWNFQMREGLTFHTGKPINADTVAASLNWTNNPEGGGFVFLFWGPVESITATPDNTVRIDFSHPFIGFPTVANNGYATVFDTEIWERLRGDYGTTGEDGGSGPFTLTEYVPGSHLEVARWADYQGSTLPFHQNQGAAYIDGIRWVDVPEAATRAAELEEGNIDALHAPAFSDVQRLKDNPDLVVIENVTWGHYFMGLNHERTNLGFNDPRVRLAISKAINRQAIVDTVFFGSGEPAYGFVPTADKYYDAGVVEFSQYDPETAASLLDAAGWSIGSDGIRESGGDRMSFTLPSEPADEETQVAQAVQEFLRDAGVDMNFTPTETVFGDIIEGDIDGYFFNNLWHDMIDGTLFWAKGEFIGGCCNGSRADIPEVNEGYDKWIMAANEEEREAASRQIQLAAAEQVPFLPIVTPANVWVHNQRVHGWDPLQPNLYPFYQDVWIEA